MTSAPTAHPYHLEDVVDLVELLPQNLFLMEGEGRVVGGHGEQQEKLLLRPPVLQWQAIVTDHRVNVRQGPVQDPRRLPVVRGEQGDGHQQLAADQLVRDVGEAWQVRGVVGFDLRIPERVGVLTGQVFQAGAEETELDGDTEVQEATQELGSLCWREGGEPAVDTLPLNTAPGLHHSSDKVRQTITWIELRDFLRNNNFIANGSVLGRA